ncbi:MAG: DUF6434 domain-containing protein [Pseudomonadota bacterium]
MSKPDIHSITSGGELRQWYWLKTDLAQRARSLGLKTSGGKFEILDRIAHYLDTAEREPPQPAKPAARSTFDWHAAPLGDDTLITDSYKNTQNVRRYFTSRCGDSFRFNIAFMAWMKANAGKTLAEACGEYRAMRAREAAPGYQSEIKDHNQFNQYTRDFLADNPEMSMDDVRRIWALKTQLPSASGRHRYDPGDLDLS